MAATFRSSSTANTGATAASSLAVNMPAGVAVGDALFAAFAVDNNATVTPPTGWTLTKSNPQGVSLKLAIYFRQATGTESASYTWNFGSAQQVAGTIVAYSGTSGFPPAVIGVNSNGTATTSLAGSSNNNSWSGQSLYFWATKNTTAQSTITAAATWTGRADTCTTAADFIEVEVQDLARAFPAGGIAAPTSTASQSVTYSGIVISIDDAHSTIPLAMDELFNSGFTSVASTTLTVYTNYPNELLVAMVALESGALTTSTMTASGLTWVQLGSVTTQGGDCEVWYALAPTLLNAVVVTATFSGTVVSGDFMIFGIAGIDLTSTTGSSAFGAKLSANAAASSNPKVNITTTRTNSWVFAVANSSTGNALSAAGSGQIDMHNHANGTTSSSIMLMQNTATAASGTIVAMNASSSTVANWNIYGFEVLPSLGHGLSLGGVGT